MQLFNDDCLKVLPIIPDKSIDLILTDPPYGTTQCKWDSIIPFEPMWVELKRVIKPNGAVVLFGSEPFSSNLRMSNLKMFKYDWVWDKVRAFGHLEAKNKPMKRHELITVFSFGNSANRCKNRITYNPQGLVEVNKKRKNSTDTDNLGTRKSRQVGASYFQTHTNYPNSILTFHSDKEKLHPTQKPVPLLEYLIKTYTNEGDTVLDFTMGSGSTGVACKNTNRKFIGIEMDKNYFDIAKNRIESAFI
jgi:site-specific DNA-methyltransferase (adenine-specific)